MKIHNGKSPGKDGINGELIKNGGKTLMENVHMLVLYIWKKETMPKEWESGQIVTLHKKGDQHECQNYRGITLLSTCYKILSQIIQRRLVAIVTAQNKIGQYQCGFLRGRSTVDAIHTLKQIMEKAYKYDIEMEMLFIDFERAFDSIKREKLKTVMRELEVPEKLNRLIMMTMKSTRISIKTTKGETEEFEINKGVKQGDALSAVLFNLVLQYVTRKVNKGTLRARGGQVIAYADDIVVIAKRREILSEMVEEIVNEGNKVGLKINENKTKIMKFGKDNEAKGYIKIGRHEFEWVNKYKYLGIVLSDDGDRAVELKERILAISRAYHANKKMLTSGNLSKKTKLNIYKTIIRPVAMYAAETVTMTKKDEEELRIAERKILRKIYGPIEIVEGEYRRRMNFELKREIGEDIVQKMKQQRIKWLGHVWRADNSIIKDMLIWQPKEKGRRGRPRSSWMGEVIEDLKKIGVTDWKQKAGDRKIWKKISESFKE